MAEFFGWCILFFALFFWLSGTLISKAGEAAGKVLKDKDVQEGMKIGFWMWLNDDD